MDPSVGWFISLAALGALAFCCGHWFGKGPSRRAWVGVALAVIMLGLWAMLQRYPTVAVNAIPVAVLSYIEGTGALPLFMLITGVAFARSHLPRQKRVAILAMGLGAVYFLQGGMWMLQTTPAPVLGGALEGGVVMQSQDYSCVPAACATALNIVGIPATEAEMAQYTQTRAGTGATLIRAMDGLNQRLINDGYQVELLEPSYESLAALPMPLLTPLQFEATRRHMVVLWRVSPKGVWVADPANGWVYMHRAEFEKVFVNQVLVFRAALDSH